VYSYDADSLTVPGGATTDGILAEANNLVAELFSERYLTKAVQRPIIFLCHGFGGLLVKRALAFSSTRRTEVEHLRSIYHSTFAILFMGTPHHGVKKESLLFTRLTNHPGPSQFMLSLLEGSESLQEITDQFAPLMKKFKIYNFWEKIETYVGDKKTYIVEQTSAAPIWDHGDKCGIMATHSEMVKFSKNLDPGYRIVRAALQRYIELAPQSIRSKWQRESELIYKERVLEAQVLVQHNVPAPLQHEPQVLLQHEAQAVLEQEKPAFLQPQPALDTQFDDAAPAYINVHYEVRRGSNSYFTGRQRQADYVKKKFGPIQRQPTGAKHKIFVIHGLGGSGKTQFCLKYLEDNRPRYEILTCQL